MADFYTIYQEFGSTRDVCAFCSTYEEDNVASRFLLVRSLDKKHLKALLEQHAVEDAKGNTKQLMKKVFDSVITNEQLISYIERERSELIRQREAELLGLADVLRVFPVVNCGVRNDKVDDIVQSFVRNKALKSLESLEHQLDRVVLPRVRQYSLWSYFNQTSNDIIELFFLKHSSVLPTLRKITNIDFFLKVEGHIVPFDLKFTHISDSYFDLASQGIFPCPDIDGYDDYCVTNSHGTNEFVQIKEYYKQYKKLHRAAELPNLKGLTKNEICEKLVSTGDEDAIYFVDQIKKEHLQYVPSTSTDLKKLEWWNYKYQGERLFCNNNRFFVFLAYKDRFVDGRELKGKTEEIGQRINAVLDDLSEDKIHKVRYYYEKDRKRSIITRPQ